MAYTKLHPIKQFDFQINRVLTYGDLACRFEDMKQAAKRIHDIPTWNRTWLEFGEQAESEERVLHAAFYYRLAEFFLKESPEKEDMFARSLRNFHKVIEQDKNVEISEIPYLHGKMKSFHFTVDNPKGTIVVFGGYDSFIEEFYLVVKDLLVHEYNIVLFEGPGQGQSLRTGLKFEPHWEKPIQTILDYYNLDDVCVIGSSWGGYFALRAAAFEKRITKAVAYDVLFDGFDCMINPVPAPMRSVIKIAFALQAKPFINMAFNSMKKGYL